MALDQIYTVAKEYLPATLGAVIGAWNKRGDKDSSIIEAIKSSGSNKLSVTLIAIFAIIVGLCIGKWVSVALVGYYHLPSHVVPVLEFVTALNGIKLVDTIVKGVNKSLDVVADRVPKIVSGALDTLSVKLKKWLG